MGSVIKYAGLILLFSVHSYNVGKGIACTFLSPRVWLRKNFGPILHWRGCTNVIIMLDPVQNKLTEAENCV